MTRVQRIESTGPDHPFAIDETMTVGLSGRAVLRLPVRLVVDGDKVTLDEVPDRSGVPPVQVVQLTEFLDDELVRELTDRLAAVGDLRPATIRVDPNNTIQVPVLAPDLVGDDSVSWAVTDTLAVVHADRDEGYFTCRNRIPGRLVLTAAQAWRLVEALVSLDCWQFWLQGRFAASATAARRVLRAAPPATTPGDPVKGAR